MTRLSVVVVALAAVSSVHALTIAPDGTITDWGIKPFSDWDAGAGVITNGGLDNDWSPVDYPGVHHRPSPGGSLGEKFDLEAMYVRFRDARLEVLLLTSMPLSLDLNSPYDYTYRLGDVFINTNDDSNYEFALVAQDPMNHGFVAGELRSVLATHGVISDFGGYGGNPGIAGQVNPWALAQGDLVAAGTFASASYKYPAESGHFTWIYEWSAPLAGLRLMPDQTIGFHVTVECGNDLIQLRGAVPTDVPEPATLFLLAMTAPVLAIGRRGRHGVN